jgi:hypothetical protein
MSRKVMKLVNESTGEMECRVCGAHHWANTRPGGGFKRGAWRCVNGCRGPRGTTWRYTVFADLPNRQLHHAELERAVPEATKSSHAGGDFIWMKSRAAAIATRANLQHQHPGVKIRIYAEPASDGWLEDDAFELDADDMFVPKRGHEHRVLE